MKPVAFPEKLAIVDVETTGVNIKHDRVIEVGIVRYEGGKIVDQYTSLVNPEIEVPKEITLLTGILPGDLVRAPRFFDILKHIDILTRDAIFVAHNVRFDYAFFRNEFNRYGYDFRRELLCTVRLARQVFPGRKHYRLDDIIEIAGLTCNRRHRALDDALVLYHFLDYLRDVFPKKFIDASYERTKYRTILPSNIDKQEIDILPEAPGVYIMHGEGNHPVYIGKSKNIRERVLSHFASDLRQRQEMMITRLVRHVEHIQTAGELSALLLENQLIKDRQPLLNRRLKQRYGYTVLRSDGAIGVPVKITVNDVHYLSEDEVLSVYGVFPSKTAAKKYLEKMAKTYALCPKFLSLETGSGPCSWVDYGWCKGVCLGKEHYLKYNIRVAAAFAELKIKPWPYPCPIMIEEFSETYRFSMTMDRWCVLSQNFNGRTVEFPEPNFSPDVYSILWKTIYEKKRIRNVSISLLSHPTVDRKNITDDYPYST